MWPKAKESAALRDLPGVREFSGSTMRDILDEVRGVFGRDAIILSQENIHGRIHVLACSDSDDSVLASGQYDPAATLMGPVGETTPARISARRETRKAGIPRTGPAEANRLQALGFDPRLIQLAGKGKTGKGLAERVLELVLGDDRDFTGSGTDAPEAGAYRFIGPTGHGKSSLIGKLATAWVLAQGPQRVLLASTDRQRLGGTLLLERMAALIGVPFQLIADEDIPALVARDHALLLIDTDGGLGAGAPAGGRATRRAPSLEGVIDVLVLAATAQPEILARALHAAPRDAEVALTQLDLAPTPGLALSLVWNERPHGRVLDWISYGHPVDGSHAPASVGVLLPFVDAAS